MAHETEIESGPESRVIVLAILVSATQRRRRTCGDRSKGYTTRADKRLWWRG
jgi:hypothetical protein